MKNFNNISVILIAFFLLSFSMNAREDAMFDYATDAGDFTELVVTEGINVNYIASDDSAGIVSFSTANEGIVNNITFKNNGKGKLTVMLEPRDVGENTIIPDVTVRSKFLQSITNQGDSTIRILSMKSVPRLKVKLIGNGFISVKDIDVSTVEAGIKFGHGNITLRGKTVKASLNNTGSGTIQAGDLVAKDVKCTVLGTGNVDCTAKETLVIMGAGSGKVYYDGNPTNIRNRGAGIKAININE